MTSFTSNEPTKEMWEFILIHYATNPVDMHKFYTNYDEGFLAAMESVKEIMPIHVDDEELIASVVSGFEAAKTKLKRGGFVRDPCSDSVCLYVTHFNIDATATGFTLDHQVGPELQMGQKWAKKIRKLELENNKRKSSF